MAVINQENPKAPEKTPIYASPDSARTWYGAAARIVNAFLQDKRTGNITLHIKDGRIMAIDSTESHRV